MEALQLKGGERRTAALALTRDVSAGLRRGECVPAATTQLERVEILLEWAARKYPGQLISYADIGKVVLRLERRPRRGSAEMKRTRHLIQDLAPRLESRTPQRWSVIEPGVGARATVDVEDFRKHVLPRRVKRAKDAVRAWVEWTMGIDPDKLTASVAHVAPGALEMLKRVDWAELRPEEVAHLEKWRVWALTMTKRTS